jgi:hypothetical protein
LDKTRNDLTTAVPKLCLALEEHRRTADGRVRSSQELLAHFFPHDSSKSEDRLFKYMPNDVRGPILAAWGIRGAKAALRDTDEKVQSVIHDALVAGDLEHVGFEEGLSAATVVLWSPLSDWWAFWRGGKLSKNAIQKALVSAYELALFDAKWFLDSIDSRGGKLRGTDVLAEGLTKDDMTEWLRNVHQSGDGSAKGLLAALGWDKIVAKTTNDVLIAVLDAIVVKVGLVKSAAKDASTPSMASAGGAGSTSATPSPSSTSASSSIGASTAPSASATTSTSETGAPEAPGVKGDDEWSDTDAKSQRMTSGGEASGSVENMSTVSMKGDFPPAPPPPPPSDEQSQSEDIIVVDEDELSSTDNIPIAHASREEPPTSPRMETARPVPPDDEPAHASKGLKPSRGDRAPTATTPPTRSSHRPR